MFVGIVFEVGVDHCLVLKYHISDPDLARYAVGRWSSYFRRNGALLGIFLETNIKSHKTWAPCSHFTEKLKVTFKKRFCRKHWIELTSMVALCYFASRR